MPNKAVLRQTQSIGFLAICLFLLLLTAATPLPPLPPAAYVQPQLLGNHEGPVAIIISGADTQAISRAVEMLGGRVTSDLWLVDAVGAVVDARHISALAANPAVASIVSNENIGTADAPGDGYVSQRRVSQRGPGLPEDQLVPVVPLPDGGAVSITKKGVLVVLDAGGATRATLTLPGGNYKTSPLVGHDGNIFVTREEKAIFAISPSGALLWQYDRTAEKLKAAPVLAMDGGVLVVDEKRTLYCLDPHTGQQKWHVRVGPDSDGTVLHAPLVGPDGVIYVSTDKGYLIALDPSGNQLWNFAAPQDKPLYRPVIGDSGVIFLANSEKNVYGVSRSNGSLLFSHQLSARIVAEPALGPDGALYVADEKLNLYAIDAQGAVRFHFAATEGGTFASSPVVAADGSAVYIAAEDGWLYAVDTATGSQLWRYKTLGKIKDSPTVDRWGTIVVGSEGKDLVFLTPKGQVAYQMTLSGKVTQRPGANGAGNLVVRVEDDQLVTVGRLPDHWDGSPDVVPTGDSRVYEFYSPVSIDIGADVLHEGSAEHGVVTGKGVTVAVVDSGVYFDHQVRQVLGGDLQRLFIGQADFVGDGICQQNTRDHLQYSGYCWTNQRSSTDRYGHGSHIAGAIWNRFVDGDTGVNAGVAPDTSILSVRVLGDNGVGTYEDVIEGIQFVVENKDRYNVRILNLSLSAYVTTPYFVDPLNRAAEAAWANGIVVLAAAGNMGPNAETVTVPGNDPYIITVGAIDGKRTAGYWADDVIPAWSSTGPTPDGFVKPDVLAPGANIVSFMYNDPNDVNNSAYLVRLHPDYSETTSLFRMNGTSMATAVASGVVSLMLEAHPQLTPEQVKFRLLASARSAVAEDGQQFYSPFQEGMGRIWAPDAVWGDIPLESANSGLDIHADLAHPWRQGDPLDPAVNRDLDHHYLGPVQRLISDDGNFYLYFLLAEDGAVEPLGIARIADMRWVDSHELNQHNPTFNEGQWSWSHDYLWSGARYSWSGGRYSWSGGRYSWGGARYSWGGARYSWGGARYSWGGARYSWGGARYSWSGGRYSWSGSLPQVFQSHIGLTTWVDG